MPSSSVTPVWGPQLPRISRIRERRWKTYGPEICFQARNGVTKVEQPWTAPQSVTYQNVELCSDTYRNPAFEPFRQKNFFDDGGPLTIRKGRWEISSDAQGTITPWKYNTRVRYGLHVLLSGGTHSGIDPRADLPPASDLDVSSLHAAAYAKAKPAQPLIDLATILAESRDFLSLVKTKLASLKDISDWFLALQFGWKPLLSDIHSAINTIVRLDEEFQFLVRNNGKPVRRRVQVLDETTNLTIKDQNVLGLSRNTYVDWIGRSQMSSSWRHRVSLQLTRKAWASGEFIFYLGDVSLPSTETRIKSRLLGLKVTPAVVWNAMPWTWLFDWFSNIGEILQNLSEEVADRHVARYLYLMQHTKRVYEWYGTDGYYSARARHIYDTKVRESVHPYGLSFGGNLSPKQFAILAALGHQRF